MLSPYEELRGLQRRDVNLNETRDGIKLAEACMTILLLLVANWTRPKASWSRIKGFLAFVEVVLARVKSVGLYGAAMPNATPVQLLLHASCIDLALTLFDSVLVSLQRSQ
jgi:hypothetical protein